MLSLSNTYQTTHFTTRTLAKSVYEDLLKLPESEQILDFTGVEFVSRSFMVQLYSMLAKTRSQARFMHMNENVSKMLSLAVSALNKPVVLPSNASSSYQPAVLNL